MTARPGLPPERALDLVERAHDGILLLDTAACVTWVNDAARTLGWEPDDLIGRSVFDLIAPDDVARALEGLGAMSDGHAPPSSVPFMVRTAAGDWVECDIAAWPLGGPGEIDAVALHVRPTQDSRVLRSLLERLLAGARPEAVLADVFDVLYHRSPDMRAVVCFRDEHDRVVLVGDDLDPGLTGVDVDPDSPWATAEATGDEALYEGLASLPAAVAARAAAAGFRDCWIVPVRSDDACIALVTVWVTEGGAPARMDLYSVRFVAQLIELVLRWRRETHALERAASLDPLTGLPNRRALAELDDRGAPGDTGVLYIDLDHFKPVNDRFGHAAGDEVLRTVATRLQRAVRPTDLVARLGGDEFGVVCHGCTREQLTAVADRVHRLLAEDIVLATAVVSIGSSIGVALGPASSGDLLDRADGALTAAKQAGRDTIRWAD